ncbi:AAA-type ATPase [Parasponia andersonii]|uniref:AAA-type ATPase n=1 Tax=Parasponia andersonii TaxID=3476 RepID=A0A2P5DQB5_PARAD|nr:AAA-type ATPase [Parasponia andersonii]
MSISYLILLLGLIVSVVVVVRALLYRAGLVHIVQKWWRVVEDCFHVYQSFKVPEINEDTMQENQLYRKVSEYLNSLASIEDSDFTNLVTGKRPNEIVLRLDPNQRIEDHFLGAKLVWVNQDKGERIDGRNLVLMIRKADKRRILKPYLQHIRAVADEVEQRRRDLKLYMNFDDHGHDHHHHNHRNGRWRSIPLTHPSTFETIAMESDLKAKVKSDLESFLKAKQYYHRLGRVWKRSYLLYGPSGTGKTSFVAAMANFLGYDVYDLELSKVSDDSDLKTLLLQTTARSVIVIEDLDRFLARKLSSSSSAAVSFSGVLGFMDGLWSSCCAEERIMVFTTNGKEGLDPAMLRPGRVDVHIHFPLCDFTAFKNLANSYLGLKEHKLFPQVEEIFQSGSSLSPAEIGELMIANRNSPSRAIKSVITALQTDGDGRGTVKIRRRMMTTGDGYGSRSSRVDESGQPAGAFCEAGVHSVKDIRKLYGFLRMKSSCKSQSFDSGSGQKDG